MEIKSLVRDDIWKAIGAHYSLEDYTSALRDLMMLIKNIVQELSEISDIDGSKLMSIAFLGKDPKLLINKFETQSEKDTQNGVGLILQGLFFSIRNPLSHEDIIYSRENADAIIIFVNYILGVIDKSKGKRNVEDWISFISNEAFPDDEEYADEILKDIPTKKRLDLLIQLYRERRTVPRTTKPFISKLFELISSSEKNQFIDVIEQEMYSCGRETEFVNFLNIYAPLVYIKLSRATKLRVENILFSYVEQATLSSNDRCNNSNASIGTWLRNRIFLFEKKDKIIDILFKKLNSDNEESRNYVKKFFLDTIVDDEKIVLSYSRKRALHARLKDGDTEVHKALSPILELTPDSDWAKEFKDDYESFVEIPF
jgi:uncharacterized protein (TIGR02391 family)